MSVYSKLLEVQAALKAPKDKNNDFGKYKYRSFESICEAVKEHLQKAGATIVVTDDMMLVGERYYIKATAVFIDVETGESVSNTALARESLSKKGMDDSQVTGTASSYARKYAMNGLLLIDDTKDADTNEYNATIKQAEEAEQEVQRKVSNRVKYIIDNGEKICTVEYKGEYVTLDKVLPNDLRAMVNLPQYAEGLFDINAELDRRGIK